MRISSPRSALAALVTLALVVLCGCGPTRTGHLASAEGPLTPLPDTVLPRDPEDHVLNAAIEDYLKAIKAPLFTRYDFTRVDLDNDGRRDALVMMKGPHHYWCDANGCTMAIFAAANDHFTFTSEIFPVRGPLYVSENMTQGWRDIIVRVSGQSYAKAKDVALQFDGTRYPRNPFFQPAMPDYTRTAQAMRMFP